MINGTLVRNSAAAVFLLAPAAAFAAPVQIDDFSTSQVAFLNTSPDSLASPAGAIGDRELTIEQTNAAPSLFFEGFNSISGGEASTGFAAGIEGFSTMEWSGFAMTDFTDGGLNDAIGISVNAADSTVNFTFTVTSATGTGSYMRPANGNEDLYFLFSGFSGTVDFAQVTGISLHLTGGAGWDAKFDLIQATKAPPPIIPLPAGAWLMLGGMGAFAAVKRRKQKQA